MIIAGSIKRLEDWYCKAGPKDSEKQWADGHSAKEFAKLWFNQKGLIIPSKIKECIDKIYPSYTYSFIIPEHITPLDNFQGGQRNHDLLIYGKYDHNYDGIVCIEAKATESLDDYIENKLKKSSENSNSRLPDRINNILTFFNLDLNIAKDLRYQLFTGLYGTYQEAVSQQTSSGVFMVVQLVTSKTSDKKIRENEKDIQKFINIISTNNDCTIEDSCIFGPFTGTDKSISLYLAYVKITVNDA